MSTKPVRILLLAIVFALPIACLAQQQRQQGPGGQRFRDMDHFAGTVTAIQGDTITVKTEDNKNITVKVTPETRFRKQRQEAKLADLKIGDRIMGAGKASGTDTFNAQFVGIGMMGLGGGQGGGGRMMLTPEQMREALGKQFIIGEVKAVDDTKLTILRPDGQTQVIEVDENTSFRDRSGQSVTLADIKVGDYVGGRGELHDGVFVPTTLRVGVQPPPIFGPQTETQPEKK